MYYETKIINGVLHWRSMPDGVFKPFTAEQLTAQIEEQRANNAAAVRECNDLHAKLRKIQWFITDYQQEYTETE